jgi:hypothetical protein
MIQPVRPLHTTIGVYILYGTIAIALARLPFAARTIDPSLPSKIGFIVGAFAVVASAAVVLMISRGRNWARVLFALLFIFGIPTTISIISSKQAPLADSPAKIFLLVFQIAAHIAALALLFFPASNAWFRTMKAQRRLTSG